MTSIKIFNLGIMVILTGRGRFNKNEVVFYNQLKWVA